MEQEGHANGRRLGLRKPSDEQTISDDRGSEASHSACRMVFGGVPEVWC